MSQFPPMSPGPIGSHKPHRGVLILILGICGFFCIVTAIAAWVMGSKDLKEMDAGTMDPAGRGMTKAGKICGIVFVILGILGLLLNFALGGLLAASGASGGGPGGP